ncbi:integration host factor subunit alpha [Actinobacillus pleuropneumoniae]|nr:integration host factor subunit alpha [Actinobacillus pleuropneumoniae]
MALTKIELAESLVEKCGFDKRIAKLFVEQFFEEIRSSWKKAKKLNYPVSGNFSLREKNARPGRNPKTGETVAVTARRVVVFKPGQKLRDRVENVKVKA